MAQPWVSDVNSGSTSMPMGSRATCGAGESDTCPPLYAVGSPRRHAASACMASCTVVENRKALNQMKPVAKSMCTNWLSAGGEKENARCDGSQRALRLIITPGSDLLSHTPAHAVPSAVAGLT